MGSVAGAKGCFADRRPSISPGTPPSPLARAIPSRPGSPRASRSSGTPARGGPATPCPIVRSANEDHSLAHGATRSMTAGARANGHMCKPREFCVTKSTVARSCNFISLRRCSTAGSACNSQVLAMGFLAEGLVFGEGPTVRHCKRAAQPGPARRRPPLVMPSFGVSSRRQRLDTLVGPAEQRNQRQTSFVHLPTCLPHKPATCRTRI